MGYTVKVVNKKTGKATTYPAPRGTQTSVFSSEMITRMQEEGREDYSDAVPGVEVELIGQGRVVRIPDEGDEVYIMNDHGSNVDVYRWPIKGEE